MGLEEIKGPFTTLEPKTSFTPPLTQYSNIDTFVNLVSNELRQLKPNIQKRSSNLSNNEKRAFESLLKRDDLVLKPSDKGSNVCVINRQYYMTMISNLLSDTDTYVKLEGNPTTVFPTELKDLLMGAKKKEILSDAEFKFIYNAMCIYIYILIHTYT